MIARRRFRSLSTLVLASALGVALLAGCGGDDDEAADTTTTAAVEESTTTAAGGGSTPSSSDDADLEATDVEWTLNATQFRDQIGKRVAYDCPPGGEASSVWGTDVYTDDSSVCTAAVHAGLIDFTDGGRVVIEMVEAQDSYEGSENDDVISQDYGAWGGSFRFP